jgi:CubicO group peptidase (beta-lactamase class C family)
MNPQQKKRQFQTIVPLIDRWLAYQVYKHEQPGLSVGIALGADTLFSRAYGLAELDPARPLSSSTLFRIASHSKLFTAMCIMRLRQQERLGLDDPVSRHLTWFHSEHDPELQHLTLRHLLTHSSGLLRDGRNLHWSGEDLFPDREHLIAEIKGSATIYESNRMWKYSNIAFAVLGQVIEAVSGLDFHQAARELCLEPLGLNSTYSSFQKKLRDLHAVGYSPRYPNEARQALPHYSARAMDAAAGFSSNVPDLIRFYQAQLPGDERFLPDRDKREMQRVQFVDNNHRTGLGFDIATIGQRTMVGHSGGYPGFLTYSLFDPSDGLILVVLTNAADGRTKSWLKGIAGLLDYAIEHASSFQAEPESHVPPPMKLSGTYRSVWGDEIFCEVAGRLLRIDANSDAPEKSLDMMDSLGDHRYRIPARDQGRPVGESLHFEFDDNGQAARVVFPGYAARIENL